MQLADQARKMAFGINSQIIKRIIKEKRMKLLIEINDYEKLKNIVETPMDDKRRKTKNILLCVTGLPFFASLALMINAICYQKTNLIIIFSILTLIFLYCFVNILTDNGAHLVNVYNKIQEMQKSSDEQSCLQIKSWIKYSNTLEFQYFDKDGIMQRMIIPYEKRYIHKYDYYKIAGKLNEEENDYVFYLYEPYKKNN